METKQEEKYIYVEAKTKFPFAPLELVLKYPETLKTDWYTLDELYKNVLELVSPYEIGGTFDLSKGFQIQPNVSYFDKIKNRPYTVADGNNSTGIVWHSHPVSVQPFLSNSVPSREDTLFCALHPKLISLVLTQNGIYVMGALMNNTTIVNHEILWNEMEYYATQTLEEMPKENFDVFQKKIKGRYVNAKLTKEVYIANIIEGLFQIDLPLQESILSKSSLFIRFIPISRIIGQLFSRQLATFLAQTNEIYKFRRKLIS